MNRPTRSNIPDYLIFGHITRDLVEDGARLGGTAVYSSILAKRLGLNVALVTSYAPGLNLEPLDGIQIINQGGSGTTTFTNKYGPSGRTQHLLEKAQNLETTPLPEAFWKAKIIHLGPVAREIEPGAGREFEDSELAYSLQGWLRDWDQTGLVQPAPFTGSGPDITFPGTAFLSIEDLGFDRQKLDHIQRSFRDLVLTTADQGAELYLGDKMHLVPGISVEEVDPTGAGDIFAAGFIIAKVMMGKSPQNAALFANALAAISVTRTGIQGIPTIEEINEVKKAY